MPTRIAMSLILTPPLRSLARPSGAFAMLAVDQRESMRAMFAEQQTSPVSDQQLAAFKLSVLKALTPFASGVLVDRHLAWDRALAEHAVAPGCGLIAAGDLFVAGADELIADVEIDEQVQPESVRADGAKAMKLLVIWRPDEPAEKRVALADRFIRRCRTAGLLSVIEPVSRKPRDGRSWEVKDGILAAAKELGGRGADLYKAEAPLYGNASESEVRRESAKLSNAIRGPWVVLSSGVSSDHFPTAVEWACREGASGFLAGRAIWRNVIGQTNVERALQEDAVPRLRRLCDVVDRVVVAN
jgi:sulfofructosephosphate aldolase